MGNFLSDIGAITWVVLIWLSIYFISNIWIFIWRFFTLGSILNIERSAVNYLHSDQVLSRDSILFPLVDSKRPMNADLLNSYKINAIKQITSGLSMLSIISSTAPFIGLFGTVIEILEAFYRFGGNDGGVTFDTIAPIISKALIATAFGILTAIPAYSFYIILKRRAYEIATYIDMQIGIILSNVKSVDSKITLG